MNHYCTYFDRGFLIQGLALRRSILMHDPGAVFWVLALDDFTAKVLINVGGERLRVVRLKELEEGDAGLAAAKADRSRVEYYFTLSPCWPRWLLARNPEMERVTYVDADMLFFASADTVFHAMDRAGASVLMTSHRFPSWLSHYEKHGIFNVGILSFRNDEAGRACLDDWRARCLAWCHDRLEDGKYADQKYLEDWPARFGDSVHVMASAGVNAAPWNWAGHRCEIAGTGAPLFDGEPLVLFHFARFRPIFGTWWWQSGHLDYGIMPWKPRQVVYGAYWRALKAARDELRAVGADVEFNQRPLRLGRSFWRGLPMRLVFGGDWLRIGDAWISGRCGLGRFSGQVLASLRRIFFRK